MASQRSDLLLRTALLAAATAAFLAATTGAALGSDQPEVTRTAWAWRAQPSEPLPTLESVAPADPNSLAVAHLGQPDKVAYLDLDLRGNDYESLTLVLAVESSAPPTEPTELRACSATGEWPARRPFPWDERPTSQCDVSAVAEQIDGRFTFDLTSLASSRLQAQDLVVTIEPVEDSADFDAVLTVALLHGVVGDVGASSSDDGEDEAGQTEQEEQEEQTDPVTRTAPAEESRPAAQSGARAVPPAPTELRPAPDAPAAPMIASPPPPVSPDRPARSAGPELEALTEYDLAIVYLLVGAMGVMPVIPAALAPRSRERRRAGRSLL